jgi:Ca2+-binding RTX toxin-like protein
VQGTEGNDHITFCLGDVAGDVIVELNGVSYGPYQPTGRLVAFGQAGDDTIHVAGDIDLRAWLCGQDGGDRLKGGSGNDVLLGGADSDLLVGKSGRDLLIGGIGADRIVGNADDDILIAGYTTHDTDPAALDAIMNEWTRPDTEATYEQRINHLDGSLDGGLNGLVLLTDETVSRDRAADVLTGSAGLDWFWFDEADDNDRATDLRDEVFVDDLAWIEA